MASRELDTLIFFVTSHCNSKCRTCFYWEELNQASDLSFDEIRKLSSTMPGFNELWLSGGEPTLRDDLVSVLELFYRDNDVRSINFPANGLLPQKLADTLEATFARCPEIRVNLNLALDGIGATHDRIRGVPGNFDRALESLELLQELRDRDDRLRLHVNSVVCRDNVGEMLALGAMVRERFDLDGHYFQIIRGEPMDPALARVHKSTIERLYEDLKPLYRHYAAKVGERKGFLGRAGYLGVLGLYHEIQAANLDRHHRWPMPCTAARNIAVVDADGGIRACELRERLGNLRDYDCDWSRFWSSRERASEIAAIERDGCWCTHVCFIHASLKASAKAIAIDVPRAYWNQRKEDNGRSIEHRA
jgi:MoaA/NifB/PqqE/SkfB family radical SAM enzyme